MTEDTRPWIGLTCALIVGSCVGRGAPGAAPVLRVPDPGYIDQSVVRTGDLVHHLAVAPGDPRTRLAGALGVPILRHAGLPPNVREVRIMDFAATPEAPFVRILIGPQGVAGQAGVLTTAVGDSSAVNVLCSTEPRVRGCVRLAPLHPGMDWPGIAARLDALGVWARELECRFDVPSENLGMWWSELSVETLEGDRRSSQGCAFPRRRSGAVREIFELLLDATGSSGSTRG